MNKTLIIFLLCLIPSSLLGQDTKIDSLIQVYHSDANDSAKAAALNKLAWKFMFSNPDTTKLIARSAINLSSNLEAPNLLINATNNLATSFAVKGQFDSSLYYFKKAERLASSGDDPKNVAMVQNNIGLVYWNQGKLDSAISTYRKALGNYAKLDEILTGSANIHNNMGLIYNDMGFLDSALRSYQLALKIFDTLDIQSRAVANTYNNIGIIYKVQGRFPNALDFYLKALKVYEEIEDLSDSYANTLTNIGVIYKEQKEFNKALEYYHKAQMAYQRISDQSMGLASTLNNIGIIYKLRGETEKALNSFDRALEMLEQMGDQSIGMANSLSNIGSIKEGQGNIEEAYTYYSKAKKIQASIGDQVGYAKSLFYLGNLKIENKQIQQGIAECKESLALAEELGLLEVKMDACDCLADAYERINNGSMAYAYFKKYISYRDSLSNQENTRAITQKAMSYEFEKIQYQDSLRRAEVERVRALEQREKDLEKEAQIERQQLYTVAGGVGFLLMLGLAFVLFRGYKNKQKANEIITAQKEEVENQKIAVEEQKEIIEEKNREIVDSISYAKRIQSAILPSDETIRQVLPDAFVMFQPKDIVSGDFYWLDEKGDEVFFAAVDCTGHGVPGAMVSVVGHNGLNRVLNEFKITEPAAMLDKLNLLVEETFEHSTETVKDGMDMGICCLNRKTKVLQYAGANNPLYLVRDGELIEYKADKQPIGKFDYRTAFTNHEIQLQDGDAVYVFSDGYADQFGGEKGKKFMYKPFKRLLTSISTLKVEEQKSKLFEAFQNWKGELEQIDDVCVFGVKV